MEYFLHKLFWFVRLLILQLVLRNFSLFVRKALFISLMYWKKTLKFLIAINCVNKSNTVVGNLCCTVSIVLTPTAIFFITFSLVFENKVDFLWYHIIIYTGLIFLNIDVSYNYKLTIVEHVIFLTRDRKKLRFWRSNQNI